MYDAGGVCEDCVETLGGKSCIYIYAYVSGCDVCVNNDLFLFAVLFFFQCGFCVYIYPVFLSFSNVHIHVYGNI